ncbi:MAG: SDR family oxidoreductase [Nitrospinota bacterium]|nr:SDR family oxidoreductase [Nitrospinota bacterium]
MPTAIITGGAVRIGKALACHLADHGWSLALHHNSSPPDEVLACAQQAGVTCKTYPGSLTDLVFAENLVKRVTDDFSDVSLLINSAANFIQENVEQTSTQTLSDTMALNLMSPYLLMREYKKRVGKGMIVNILDERITKNIPTFAAYSVSKVALEHVTKLAAVEWGETVRVNAIAPGLILPPAGKGQEYLDKNKKNVPTQTHGDVSDLTRALDYLLASPFVNGEILFVDGGASQDRLSQN